ncbi:MAG: MFS transporter [Deltaproteobacteria bacterium]|nr:MAG: MFS transporter [Deltaproteobacteria bacterium]
MAVSRATIVDARFKEVVRQLRRPADRRGDLDGPVRPGSGLSGRQALALFDAQLESRLLDLLARELKTRGQSFYTIGSSGHEGNAAVAAAARPSDPALLHYRSGPFFLARAQQVPGPAGAFDVLRGCCATADEPISGGRHKVFGSVPLAIPPQTSTIASHLPKAVGYALTLDRRARREGRTEERIVICTFGDASANHATATTAFNAAGWTTWQRLPCPVLFVCEDNGLGISVRTPDGWIEAALRQRPGLRYFSGDGLDLPDAYDNARRAVQWVRQRRSPAVLHLRTVRLLGHAGSDVEQLYRSQAEIESSEATDPLIATATLLVEQGYLTPKEVLDHYQTTRERLSALAEEATRRPRLRSRAEVMRPLFVHDREAIARAIPVGSPEARRQLFGEPLPEESDRPRPLAFQLNRALHDILLAEPRTLVFGEDVARKGGVYHVTAGLTKAFGVGRVFNTLLDETSILGLAQGAAMAGMLPIAEIQYLAYLMNAVDQLRGEAASLQFFSQGQFSNPMVVRIAGLAYQRGFGGHFHNDNGIAALREIPGILLGCPSTGADAARMLRTMVGAASACGRVCVMLEPIALYHTKDRYEEGDGGWLTTYPPPQENLPIDEVGVHGDGQDLCLISYANGRYMSERVAHRLRARGISCRVLDLRWLLPLPLRALEPHAEACGKVLIVDECRASSGVADTLAAHLQERLPGKVRTRRVTAPDTYIPLGGAADHVLVSEAEIEAAAIELLEAP